MELYELRSPLDRLARRGDARGLPDWANRDPDYVDEFGLTTNDVPDLVMLAQLWLNADGLPNDEHLWSAPIHAWRALGQLGALEIVQPLLEMQGQLRAQHDDWYMSEFHDVFALIGPAAVPALVSYFRDRGQQEYPRVSAAHGLSKIAMGDLESRAQVVELFTEELASRFDGQYDLNGFLISYLMDLRAVESAEVIERAFAANVVDEFVCGDWQDVRDALGVEELGLLRDRPRRSLQDLYGLSSPDHGLFGPSADIDRPRQRLIEKKAKAKRKEQKRSRRRNRRAK